MKWYKNKILIGGLIGVGVALISGAFVFTDIFRGLHNRFSNGLYTTNNPSEEIVIVAIDDKTFFGDNAEISKLGKFSDWSRAVYADLLKIINEQKPKTIGFDIIFNTKSNGLASNDLEEFINNNQNSESSNMLIGALEKYRGFDAHPADISFSEQIGASEASMVLAASGITDSATVLGAVKVIKHIDQIPLPIFDELGTRKALVDTFADHDQFVRRVSPVFLNKVNNQPVEHFSFKTARSFLNGPLDKTGTFTSEKYIMDLGDRKLEIPLENGEMLINYFAPPYKFNNISFGDVLDGKIAPEVFKDKIVLIGVTTPLIPDHLLAPTSSTIKTPGVEIHANAIQTILDQKFLYNQSALSQILMILIGSIVLAIALNYLNPWLGLVIILCLGGAHTASAHYLFQNNGLILHMMHPHVALGLTYISSIIYRYFAEVKQNKVIKGAFSHYVNAEVVNELLKHPEMLKLGGQKREITVFFSDIENFTNISEKMAPEALVELMNEYMDAMSKVILKFGGTLDKYEGDAIMAFFNAPLDQPDHVLRAAETVLSCRQQLKFLHQKWQHEGKPLLNFRVGLASGEAVVGNMGSEERFDYTAMGDVVNTGSRLESANKQYGTRTMVNQACAEALMGRYVLRELDLIQVKGKDQPVQVYELLARKGELPEAGVKLLGCFTKGLELYRQQQFEQALVKFEECLEIYPDDQPTQTYISRCQVYLKTPPAEGWDGVYILTRK